MKKAVKWENAVASYLRHQKALIFAIIVLIIAGIAKFQAKGGHLAWNLHVFIAIALIVVEPFIVVVFRILVKSDPSLVALTPYEAPLESKISQVIEGQVLATSTQTASTVTTP